MSAESVPEPVERVRHHPRLVGLGRGPTEQRRVERFAVDLARWLWGRPRQELGPLARVVTAVARRELATPRRLCRGRVLLAVEAAARATEAMWPLLRGPEEPEDDVGADQDDAGTDEDDADEEGANDQGDTAKDDEGDAADPAEGGGLAHGATAQAGGSGQGVDDPGAAEGAGEAEPTGTEASDGGQGLDPSEVLASLAEMATLGADPELDALADQLRELFGEDADAVEVGVALADVLAPAGDAAVAGALETDRLARTLEQFVPGVGWSTAQGQLEQSLVEQLDRLVALLDQLPELGELADALGRLDAASRKAGPDDGGREEVVGVRLGGDVTTALPSELGLLGDPATEDLFYQRFAERRLVSLELSGGGDEGVAQGERRGPVIACIDTSASMAGAPELAAKALVLAVCRQVLPAGRVVQLLLFGGPGALTELRLRRGLGGLEGLLDFLALGFHQGTDFDGPLLRALELLDEQELERADILVVTDGLCQASHSIVERVERARQQRGVRVWSVVLGRYHTHGVAPFSDEVWQLAPDHAASALGLLRRFRRPGA